MKPGWKIIKVNGKDFKDENLIKNSTEGKEPFVLTFKTLIMKVRKPAPSLGKTYYLKSGNLKARSGFTFGQISQKYFTAVSQANFEEINR